MAENSAIEWTDASWNPLAGCNEISPGCRNCYAAVMAHRLGAMAESDIASVKNPGKKRHYIGTTTKRGGRVVWTGKMNLIDEALKEPFKWKKPRRVFVNSMSDLFHKDVPVDFVDEVFAVMALTPQHTYQVLTKRPDRMAEYFADLDDVRHRIGSGAGCLLDGDWIWKEGKRFRPAIEDLIDRSLGLRCHDDGSEEQIPELELPLPNVWLGTSCEDQKRADERIPYLLKCPAAILFLSCEPLLGPICLRDPLAEYGDGSMADMSDASDGWDFPDIDWVITGCESGHGRRHSEQAWFESIADQCLAAGVSFFHKQMDIAGKVSGDVSDFPERLRVRQFPAKAGA